MSAIPCNHPYHKPALDAAFVGRALTWTLLPRRSGLHKLKQSAGIGGRSVIICLDDGEVSDPVSEESIGNPNDEP